MRLPPWKWCTNSCCFPFRMRQVLITVVALGVVTSIEAQIVSLSNGRHFSAREVTTVGETLEIRLSRGGTLTIPLSSVERVLEPELATPEDLRQLAEIEPEQRSWRFDPEREPLFDSVYDGWIYHLAREYDVDAALVSAVIRAESDFDPTVVSHAGAEGLMQLMPATARRFGVANSFDPVENMRGGIRYLSWLIEEMEGNLDHVLAGYNAGEGNVRKYEGVPPFRETVNYIAKIKRWLDLEDSDPS